MIFTLEALEAKFGDALLLHYGKKAKPRLIVIDGGPAGVYKQTLSKRLAAIKAERSPGVPLPIRMVMISHLDDDHINGILQLLKAQVDLEAHGQADFNIATVWHNSFDDLLGNDPAELTASLESAIKTASAGASLPSSVLVHDHAKLVLASVGQGRHVRDLVNTLGLTKNEGFSDNLVMTPEGKKGKNVSLGENLTFTVIGPRQERVRELQIKWDKEIKKAGVARIAAYVDESVFNLSSIVVLAKADGKTMLLTGDARGDDILTGLTNAGLLKNKPFHVNLLKLPHHGSDHNVATDFFRRVTADHYVCSGNGVHGNPEIATLKMIREARGTAPYSIHLTNREPRLEPVLKKAGPNVKVIYRKTDQPSIRVDLSEPL